jgi:TRAP-type C4-dicarboxylate transport system permease small subunit
VSKESSKTSGGDEEKGKGDDSSKTKSKEAASSANDSEVPELAAKLRLIDNAIGYLEQAFLVVALFSLVGVGTWQFVASHIFKINHTWPFEALRNLVFFTAMGGAALSAHKGRMISMDFVARKFARRNRIILRVFIAVFVVFACYLLFKGGMSVRNSAAAHYEVINPKTALMVLPIGAFLIGLHYTLHALIDVIYLSKGQLTPEEEGLQAH